MHHEVRDLVVVDGSLENSGEAEKRSCEKKK
jgi:hypothetical protein